MLIECTLQCDTIDEIYDDQNYIQEKSENSGNISNSNFSKLNRVASLKQIFEAASPFGKVRKNSSKIIFSNTQGRSQFVTANRRELDRSDQEPIQHRGTGLDGQERDQGIGPMESSLRREQPRQKKKVKSSSRL